MFAGWNDYCLTDLAARAGRASPSRSTAVRRGPIRSCQATRRTRRRRGWRRRCSAPTPMPVTRSPRSTRTATCSSAGSPSTGSSRRTATCTSRRTAPTRSAGIRSTTSAPGRRQGTPSSVHGGIFQDKPMVEVDRTGGANDGNVYVCWSRFTGAEARTRSTSADPPTTGTPSASRSRSPVEDIKSVQGCDIAIEADGDVYVTFRDLHPNQNQVGRARVCPIHRRWRQLSAVPR